jgi:hypothetical protein
MGRLRRPRRSGRRSILGLGALALGAALALSACGQQGGLDLARQACVHVERSIHDYERSLRPGLTTTSANQLRTSADRELRAALPLAADANSSDGSWNSLMTTISESATVDEGHLLPALKGQCTVANTNVNVNPQNPQS